MEVNNIINVLAKDHEALDCYADSLGESEFVKTVRQFLKDFDDHNYQYVYEKYKQLFVMDKYTKEGLSLCRY
jgi:hemerythrin superfamily protein